LILYTKDDLKGWGRTMGKQWGSIGNDRVKDFSAY